MQNPTYKINLNLIGKQLKKAGYSIQYQPNDIINGITMQNPTYITNLVEKPLEKAGYSIQYQLNGFARYVRGKYEVNIMLDMSSPFRLYLARRRDVNDTYGIMSTADTLGTFIYENASFEEFMKIATKPDSDILKELSNMVTEKTLAILE